MSSPVQINFLCTLILLTLPASPWIEGQATTPPRPTTQSQPRQAPGVLNAVETGKVLPATVFFRGLSAPVQARNSGGVRFPDGRLMMATLVDTSGYSTSVQEKYQAYLLTELPLQIGSHTLAPGAYGCGFIANDAFIVQDIGAHDLFTDTSTRDAELRRPSPLQVLPVAGHTGEYRLYAGRSYIAFRLAEGTAPAGAP